MTGTREKNHGTLVPFVSFKSYLFLLKYIILYSIIISLHLFIQEKNYMCLSFSVISCSYSRFSNHRLNFILSRRKNPGKQKPSLIK